MNTALNSGPLVAAIVGGLFLGVMLPLWLHRYDAKRTGGTAPPGWTWNGKKWVPPES